MVAKEEIKLIPYYMIHIIQITNHEKKQIT